MSRVAVTGRSAGKRSHRPADRDRVIGMSHRRSWSELPESVRARVRSTLGGAPVAIRGCEGGFSTSTADVLTGPDGGEVFVKAVRRADNPGAWDMNRREAAVLAAVPGSAPVPTLLDVFEDEDWFTLVTTVARGRIPEQPWRADQLDAALDGLETLQETTRGARVPELRSVPELPGDDLLGFERVAADPPRDLDPWIAEHLPGLVAAAARGIPALDGDVLCHSDLRASNLWSSRAARRPTSTGRGRRAAAMSPTPSS